MAVRPFGAGGWAAMAYIAGGNGAPTEARPFGAGGWAGGWAAAATPYIAGGPGARAGGWVAAAMPYIAPGGRNGSTAGGT